MAENTIIVLDPAHITVHMLVQRMRAGIPFDAADETELRKNRLLSGLEAWAAKHDLTLAWSNTPGRRSKGREYRIAYLGDGLDVSGREAFFDAFDAEMLRLMLA